MKAHWMEAFDLALEDLKAQQGTTTSFVIHSKHAGNWNQLLSERTPVSSISQSILDSALELNAPVKGPQKRYLFPLRGDHIVVEVFFDRSPQQTTIKSVNSSILKIREDSQHKFDAHHDSLTNCRNRKSFEKDILLAVESMAAIAKTDSSTLVGNTARSLALVTLDIDYFKRVNDTHGHDYGDVVLKAFAWTIDDYCRRATSENDSVRYSLYRLGGEEFNILIVGEIEERDLVAWVDQLREHIQAGFIPSDSQFEVIQRDQGAPISAPIRAERRITASFGISRVSGSVSMEDVSKIMSRLKTHADKALNSAKQSGRNCVRYFPDILKRFGRVIERDKISGAIAIDIGSEVGVVVGREFFVVPERYTGEVNYVADDGRSRRTLGKYPRIRIAKIVAFDVQPEISFFVLLLSTGMERTLL